MPPREYFSHELFIHSYYDTLITNINEFIKRSIPVSLQSLGQGTSQKSLVFFSGGMGVLPILLQYSNGMSLLSKTRKQRRNRWRLPLPQKAPSSSMQLLHELRFHRYSKQLCPSLQSSDCSNEGQTSNAALAPVGSGRRVICRVRFRVCRKMQSSSQALHSDQDETTHWLEMNRSKLCTSIVCQMRRVLRKKALRKHQKTLTFLYTDLHSFVIHSL